MVIVRRLRGTLHIGTRVRVHDVEVNLEDHNIRYEILADGKTVLLEIDEQYAKELFPEEDPRDKLRGRS